MNMPTPQTVSDPLNHLLIAIRSMPQNNLNLDLILVAIYVSK